MDAGTVTALLQDAVMVVLKCAMPMIASALIIGVVVSIFQAATQINEQTLAFVPKIVGVFLALVFSMSFIVTEVNAFVHRVFELILQLGV